MVAFFAVSILLYEVSYLILPDPDNISNVEEFRSLGLCCDIGPIHATASFEDEEHIMNVQDVLHITA